MRAFRILHQAILEDNPLIQQELPVPEPGPGQVLLRVLMCGVCHTDLHTLEGDIHPASLPLTPGHQVVGVVEKLGPGVKRPSIGERVGVPWLHSTDRTCAYCLRGEENLCPNARFTGFHVDGGFAEYMLAQADFVLPLPPKIGAEQAAPLLCAGIVGYRSLKRAELKPGERLGLAGFGASAHLSLQVARYWDCPVYVFTRSAQHRRHALELGAEWAGSIDQTPPHLLDRIILFAPDGGLVPLLLERIRPGGTLAINAIHTSPIPEMPYGLIYGERTLRSVANATRQDGVEFLDLAAKIPIHATTRLYPLEQVNQALADLKFSRLNGEAVLKISD
jgi:alcohol dehydrogenase, propanol-preferring